MTDPCSYLQDQIDDKLSELSTVTDLRRRSALISEIAQLQDALAACRNAQWVSNLTIVAVEQTQSTQFFRFNGQGSGAGEDNSIPMIAGKPLVLRAYVNLSSIPGIPIPRTITGTVSYGGRPDLQPFSGPIIPQPASAIDRGILDHTLNFVVPFQDCFGSLRFTVSVFDPNHRGQREYTSRPVHLDVTFEPVPRPKLHLELIHYTGQGRDIPSPSGFSFALTLDGVARVFPISYFDYVSCDELPFSGDLLEFCWPQLMGLLYMKRAMSGTSDIFVALIPLGTPAEYSGSGGCGFPGIAAIRTNWDWSALAQELGHAFRRSHAPCGDPPLPDPCYPRYDDYPRASIGEYAVDLQTYRGVYSPTDTYDFMSYCRTQMWVSPYTYLGLKDAIATNAAAIQYAASLEVPKRESLLLRFRQHLHGKVTVDPGFIVRNVRAIEERPPARTHCELVDGAGVVLRKHQCHRMDPHRDEDDAHFDFCESIPWDSKTRSIHFFRDKQEIGSIAVEKNAPKVTVAAPRFNRAGKVARLNWKGIHERPLTYVIRHSHDGGETWQIVAADLKKEQCAVNTELLRGGDRCVFQVLASSGVRTAIAETRPFSLPQKPRRAYILSPQADSLITEGEPLTFRGGGFSSDFGRTDLHEGVWGIVKGEVLGTGFEFVTRALPVGRHEIKLTVPDGVGGIVSTSSYVEVRARKTQKFAEPAASEAP